MQNGLCLQLGRSGYNPTRAGDERHVLFPVTSPFFPSHSAPLSPSPLQASYGHAFGAIRQLALSLRGALSMKTADAYKEVGGGRAERGGGQGSDAQVSMKTADAYKEVGGGRQEGQGSDVPVSVFRRLEGFMARGAARNPGGGECSGERVPQGGGIHG